MFEKYEEDVLWDLMEILKLLIRSCLLEGVKGKIRRLFAQRSQKAGEVSACVWLQIAIERRATK